MEFPYYFSKDGGSNDEEGKPCQSRVPNVDEQDGENDEHLYDSCPSLMKVSSTIVNARGVSGHQVGDLSIGIFETCL